MSADDIPGFSDQPREHVYWCDGSDPGLDRCRSQIGKVDSMGGRLSGGKVTVSVLAFPGGEPVTRITTPPGGGELTTAATRRLMLLLQEALGLPGQGQHPLAEGALQPPAGAT